MKTWRSAAEILQGVLMPITGQHQTSAQTLAKGALQTPKPIVASDISQRFKSPPNFGKALLQDPSSRAWVLMVYLLMR